MKRIVEDTVTSSGLPSLLGEQVFLMCMNYTYAGKLVGVNSDHVELSGASVVYETGEWSAKAWKDAQKVHCEPLRVMIDKIEAYGVGK
jgi:hypothetical protein